MVRPVVAVEETLGDVAEYLAANGVEVRPIKDVGAERSDLEGCQAVVISGLDRDFGGRLDVEYPVPVIEARGRKPETILAAVLERAGYVPAPPEWR
ncbi:MAG: YkuS family protein [Clostridia bacterium]|nr:YkuS family protein [Clostridia bacterium]MDH7572917.1 YkuS family protein [Clostridia bacterium]